MKTVKNILLASASLFLMAQELSAMQENENESATASLRSKLQVITQKKKVEQALDLASRGIGAKEEEEIILPPSRNFLDKEQESVTDVSDKNLTNLVAEGCD